MSADENIMKDNVFNTDGDDIDTSLSVLSDLLQYTEMVDGVPYVHPDFISAVTKAVAMACAKEGDVAGVAAAYKCAKVLIDLANARVALGF